VLTDPQKRAIYDALGESGLNMRWEVGQKFKSPEEVSHVLASVEFCRDKNRSCHGMCSYELNSNAPPKYEEYYQQSPSFALRGL
jgi:DnaJ-class molecular chaperone